MANYTTLNYTERDFSSGLRRIDYRNLFFYPFARPELAVGDALIGLGRMLDKTAERQQTIEAQAFKTQIQQQYYNTYYAKDTGMVHQRKGLNAAGLTNSTDELSAAIFESDEYKSLPGLLRVDFDNWYAQYATNEKIKLSRIEEAELMSGLRQESDIILDSLAQTAATLPLDNGDGFAILRQQLTEAMVSRGELEGWSPEYTAMQERNAFSSILANAALSSPVASQGFNFLQDVDEWLTPVDRENALGKLRSRLETEYARAAAERARQEGQWMNQLTLNDFESIFAEYGDIDTLMAAFGPDIAMGMVKQFNTLASANNKMVTANRNRTEKEYTDSVLSAYQEGGPEAAYALLANIDQEASNNAFYTPEFKSNLRSFTENMINDDYKANRLNAEANYKRQYLLSEIEAGRGNWDMLVSGLNNKLISTDELYKYRDLLQSGNYGAINSVRGKDDWAFFEAAVYKPLEKDNKGDINAQILVQESRRKGQDLYNELNREGLYKGDRVDMANRLFEQAQLTLEQDVPEYETGTAGKDLVNSILAVTPPGTTEETARYMISRYKTEYQLKNGVTPSDDTILKFYQGKVRRPNRSQ